MFVGVVYIVWVVVSSAMSDGTCRARMGAVWCVCPSVCVWRAWVFVSRGLVVCSGADTSGLWRGVLVAWCVGMACSLLLFRPSAQVVVREIHPCYAMLSLCPRGMDDGFGLLGHHDLTLSWCPSITMMAWCICVCVVGWRVWWLLGGWFECVPTRYASNLLTFVHALVCHHTHAYTPSHYSAGDQG
jgi:hypothetical protein